MNMSPPMVTAHAVRYSAALEARNIFSRPVVAELGGPVVDR
jgi:hypothetical protein